VTLLRRYLITGILVVIPTWATWFILNALYHGLENVLRPLLQERLQERYIPGLGALSVVLLLILVGMLANYAIGKRLLAIWDYLLTHVPVVKNVYQSLKAIVDALALQQTENLERVVMLEYPRRGIYALGFVTGETHGQIRDGTVEESVSVFLPTTPNPTSGFLLFVPSTDVILMPMSIEEGMKTIISGGMYMPPSVPNGKPVQRAVQPASEDSPSRNAGGSEKRTFSETA